MKGFGSDAAVAIGLIKGLGADDDAASNICVGCRCASGIAIDCGCIAACA